MKKARFSVEHRGIEASRGGCRACSTLHPGADMAKPKISRWISLGRLGFGRFQSQTDRCNDPKYCRKLWISLRGKSSI